MTATVHCTNVRFPGFSDVETFEGKRDLLLAYYHCLNDTYMVEVVRDEPTGSSYIDFLFQHILIDGVTDDE